MILSVVTYLLQPAYGYINTSSHTAVMHVTHTIN